jgi:hypothetical protein
VERTAINRSDPSVPLEGTRQHVLGQFATAVSTGTQWLRLVIVAVLLAVGINHSRDFLAPPTSYLKDFLAPYVMARAALTGTNPYLPLDELAKRFAGQLGWVVFPHPSPHPPPVAIIFMPLALFDYATAAEVWLGLGLTFVGIAIYLIAREMGTRLPVWGVVAIVIGSLTGAPIYEDLIWGNLNSILLLLLVGAWINLRSKRSLVGGTLLGCALLLKPFPWPLALLLLLLRDWRAVLGSAVTVVVGYIASMLILGPALLMDYVVQILPDEDLIYRASSMNVSLWSVGWRVFDGTGLVLSGQVLQAQIVAPPAFHSPGMAPIVAAGVPILILLISCRLAMRMQSFDAAYALMICTSILVSPIAWDHYLVLTVIPIALVAGYLAKKDFPSRETNLALLGGILLFISMPMWDMLTFLVIGEARSTNLNGSVPFGAALLTFGPTVAVLSLGLLVAALRPSGHLATVASIAFTGDNRREETVAPRR